MEDKIDEILEMIEYILKADPRDFHNRKCEYGWLFDRIAQVYKKVRQLEYLYLEQKK